VTICIKNRTESLFWKMNHDGGGIVGAGSESAPTGSEPDTILNEFGKIVEYTWYDLTSHVDGITLDEFIIMPNHIHGIIEITGNALRKTPLSEIVRQFKTFSAKRINELRGTTGIPVWQRNYYEHVIRDNESLDLIRAYIRNNPRNRKMKNPRSILSP
jgi:putative transposase